MIVITTNNVVKKGLVHGWLFWFVICLAFCLLGTSYAGWQDQLHTAGVVVTGNMNIAFTSTSVQEQENASARITYQADRLYMVIEKPEKHLYVRFEYVISNLGTVPVKFKTKFSNDPDTLLVRHSPSSGFLKPGENAEGHIEIAALHENCFFEEEDSFMLLLEYEQWDSREMVLME